MDDTLVDTAVLPVRFKVSTVSGEVISKPLAVGQELMCHGVGKWLVFGLGGEHI